MSVKLLTQYHLEFLSLKGGCTGSSESKLVKMSHCWKSHVTAYIPTETLRNVSCQMKGLLVNALIPVRALVLDLAQLTCTCQKRFDC